MSSDREYEIDDHYNQEEQLEEDEEDQGPEEEDELLQEDDDEDGGYGPGPVTYHDSGEEDEVMEATGEDQVLEHGEEVSDDEHEQEEQLQQQQSDEEEEVTGDGRFDGAQEDEDEDIDQNGYKMEANDDQDSNQQHQQESFFGSANVSEIGDQEDQEQYEDESSMKHEVDDEEMKPGIGAGGDGGGDDMDDIPVVTEADLDEHGVYKWKEFEGAIVRQYTDEQYRLLQLPFHQGWKRELVIRQSHSTREKKAGDVYYYPADGSQKLRSYVELSGYLKRNPQLELSKENFTYTKQPVWRPPDEIVRAALARGCNYVHRPMYFQKATNQVKPNRGGGRGGGRGGHHSASKMMGAGRGGSPRKGDHGLGGPGGFGRGKRKRVLPSRYDEDSFDLIAPLTKRNRGGAGGSTSLKDALSNGNSQDSTGSPGGGSTKSVVTSHHMISASRLERRLNLQKQLLQQVHEDNMKKQKELEESGRRVHQTQAELKSEEASTASSSIKASPSTSMPLKIKIPKHHPQTNHHNSHQQPPTSQLQQHLLKPITKTHRNGSMGGSTAHHYQQQNLQQFEDAEGGQSLLDLGTTAGPGAVQIEVEAEGGVLPGTARQPCSAHCPGKRNQLPNLMCSRCYCLFHIGCVPDGIWLETPNVMFLCPNCATPQDRILAKHAAKQSAKARAADVLDAQGYSLAGTLTDADPVELRQMSPSMSITKTTNLGAGTSGGGHVGSYQSMMAKMGGGSGSTSLLKTSHNGGYSMMSNGGMKRHKRGGGMGASIVPGMGHRKSSSSGMEMPLGQNGFSGNQTHQQKILAAAQHYARLNGGGGENGFRKGKFSAGSYGLSAKQAMQIQPSLNHVYRLAHGSNGHSMVIKDKTMPYGRQQAGGFSSTNIPSSSSLLSSKAGHQGHREGKGHRSGAGSSYLATSSTPYGVSGNVKSFEEKFNAIMTMTEEPPGGSSRLRGTSSNRYAKYLAKNTTVLNGFAGTISAMLKFLDYLDTRDLLSLRQTSRFWHHLTSIPSLWRQLRFRGLPITDWITLSEKIIANKGIILLDFQGVKVPATTATTNSEALSSDDSSSTNGSKQEKRLERLCSFWRHFTTLHHHLVTVRTLKFGTIPMFVLQELAGALSTTTTSIPSLKTLEVGNLIDDKHGGEGPVALGDLSTWLPSFKDVHVLRLEAKNGFVLELPREDGEETTTNRQEIVQQLSTILASFKSLRSLAMTSIRDLTAGEYAQVLGSLEQDKLTHLEIGSCAGWCAKMGEDSEGNNRLGPFEELSKCTNIVELKLSELNIDGDAGVLPGVFEHLILVERLTLENLKIEDSGFAPWTTLTALFKSLPLLELRFTTSDPFTNRALFESARDLISTQRRPLNIIWTVTVNIDDLGHCFVPLSMGTFSAAPNLDFAKRYLSVLEGPSEELYQIDGDLVAVEMGTLSDLMNRDVNLNAFALGQEAKVTVQIVPQ